jgi:uncharacterized protein (TIGR03086 family)
VSLLTIESYRRAQEGFDSVLAMVPTESWDTPSACAQWTVRDVAGHVVWAQEQLQHWATGQGYATRTGAPGALRPGAMAGSDPLATWRAARAASAETLTLEALDRAVPLPGFGERPLAALLPLLITDTLAHTWDIGYPLDFDVRLDPELVAGSFRWARDNLLRVPGFFGPEISPAVDADEQTRWLAYLGRPARQAVPAYDSARKGRRLTS